MATFTRADLTLGRVAVVRILGIDPGTQVVGFGCIELAVDGVRAAGGELPRALRGSNVVRADHRTGDAQLLGAGVLRLGGRDVSLPDRLLALAQQYRALLSRFAPTELAIEQAFYGKSVQAALRIGEARGVVLAETASSGVAVHQYAPARIKRCVTGRGAASKEAVARMMRQFVQRAPGAGFGELPTDATDAVAVAWTRLEERRSPMLQIDS